MTADIIVPIVETQSHFIENCFPNAISNSKITPKQEKRKIPYKLTVNKLTPLLNDKVYRANSKPFMLQATGMKKPIITINKPALLKIRNVFMFIYVPL